MLKIRLNDREFAKLKQYTEESGLRSMSEYIYNSILATPIIEQDELFRQLALLCLVVNGNAPKHCPSLRSVKLNRLKRKSLRNACKQISGHQHDQLSIFHLFAGNMTSAVKTYPSPAFSQESSSVPPHFSNVFRTLFKPRP